MDWYDLPDLPAGAGWVSLPWADCHLSLVASGDLGPSGHGPQALERRRLALAAPGAPRAGGSRLALEAGQVLVAVQTHSLRVVCPCADGRLEVWEGSWEPSLAAAARPVQLPDQPPVPVETGLPARLAIRRTLQDRWEVSDPASLAASWGQQEADGWLTDHGGLHLGVTVADCMNLFLEASPVQPVQSGQAGQAGIRGLLHSGWQGTGIAAVLLAAAQSLFGLDPGACRLLCGPAIAAADYPVPPDRARLFAARFGPAAVIRGADGQPCLDLVAANAALLAGTAPCLAGRQPAGSQGLAAGRIQACRASTLRHPALQSYRRDGPAAYGRMLALWTGRD